MVILLMTVLLKINIVFCTDKIYRKKRYVAPAYHSLQLNKYIV